MLFRSHPNSPFAAAGEQARLFCGRWAAAGVCVEARDPAGYALRPAEQPCQLRVANFGRAARARRAKRRGALAPPRAPRAKLFLWVRCGLAFPAAGARALLLQVRLRVIGITIDASEIKAIGTIKEDYLGVISGA